MPSKQYLLRELEKERQLVKDLRVRLAAAEQENENVQIPDPAWESEVVALVDDHENSLLGKMAKILTLVETQALDKHPVPMLPPLDENDGSPKILWRLVKDPEKRGKTISFREGPLGSPRKIDTKSFFAWELDDDEDDSSRSSKSSDGFSIDLDESPITCCCCFNG